MGRTGGNKHKKGRSVGGVALIHTVENPRFGGDGDWIGGYLVTRLGGDCWWRWVKIKGFNAISEGCKHAS